MKSAQKLAQKIVNYSLEIRENQKVFIEVTGDAKILVEQLIDEIKRVGGLPYIIKKDLISIRDTIKEITIESAKEMVCKDIDLIKDADVYIMLKSINDPYVFSQLPPDKMAIYAEYYTKTMNQEILNNTRWLSLRYPNKNMAKNADMSLEEYTKFYYKVCNIDYDTLSKTMNKLVDMMEKTDQVHITGPGTNIKFSIKNIPVQKASGRINLPDGEVYTAPVKDSINGYVTFNVATIYNGVEAEEIFLRFVEGMIVEVIAEQKKDIEEILKTDAGGRYIGEFAIGVNPYITKASKDILFDEKIAGSFHLTPGFSYKDAYNGNESGIHWDLVCIQTKKYGGGRMYFDGKLVRQDGHFISKELGGLNPIED